MEKILAVKDATYAVAERKPDKNEKFRLAGIQTLTSAIPVQCSNQYVLQSTPALRTPRYYGHPAITDSSKIPGESYRRLTEINSRYYGLSLLRTYGHFIRSQRHNFIVFSLVIADTEQHLGKFAHISSVFFLLFETVFVFFGRFPLLLSINQNSFIFFS